MECGAAATTHCLTCDADYCVKCHDKPAFKKHEVVPVGAAAKRRGQCGKHKKELEVVTEMTALHILALLRCVVCFSLSRSFGARLIVRWYQFVYSVFVDHIWTYDLFLI
jgi:hypothetical protein